LAVSSQFPSLVECQVAFPAQLACGESKAANSHATARTVDFEYDLYMGNLVAKK
jgi:hypothetical protein